MKQNSSSRTQKAQKDIKKFFNKKERERAQKVFLSTQIFKAKLEIGERTNESNQRIEDDDDCCKKLDEGDREEVRVPT